MSFSAERLDIPEILLIRPRRLLDERGWFMETFREDAFAGLGLPSRFVQDNHSCSARAGTLRGLHFQAPPRPQAKLVRVLRGAIEDVAVDIRRGSPSYGRWCAARLTAEGGEQLFVPPGFAHGFCTLAQDTEIAYKCDAYYAPELEGGVMATDPEIGIAWPFPAAEMIQSAKDKALPLLRDLVSPFVRASSGG